MKRPAKKPVTVRIIRDCRNADADYLLPKDRALDLWNQGKLQWDYTNRAYCHPTTDSHQPRLK